jgi:tetratricopeptide (TPR) repeat protein
MQSKLLFLALSILVLLLMVLFALTNPSYEKAFKAKWYYMSGEYEQALVLAKDAYKLDPYNRLALTVMKQTEIAQKFVDYIKEGKAYLEQIEAIANNPPIKEPDKIRIKMMCEVMIDRYSLLPSSKLTKSNLKDQANEIYKKFEKLYESIYGKTHIKQK